MIICPSSSQRALTTAGLKSGDPQRPPVDLRRPFDSKLMKIGRVKPDAGNVKNDRPDLIEPIETDEPSKPDEPPMLF
jgi:hypothetical protein